MKRAERKALLDELGLCHFCELRPRAANHKAMCSQCAEEQAAQRRMAVQERVDQGLCRSCGIRAKDPTSRSMCRTCIDVALESQRERRRTRAGNAARPAPLHELEPERVARDVAAAVLDHVGTLQLQILDALHVPVPPPLERTKVFRVIALLGHYAQGRESIDSPVMSYLKPLEALLRTPLGSTAPLDGLQLDAEPLSALGVFVAAALAREALHDDVPLTIHSFAALAGLTVWDVLRIVRNGTLESLHTSNGLRIAPEGARSWMSTNRLMVTWF